MNKVLLAVLISMTLTACGWQLRGAPKNLPPDSSMYVYMEQGSSDLDIGLRRLLGSAGISLVDTAETADYLLTVHGERESQRTVSVNSRGRASEYELLSEATYSIRDSSGFLLLDHARAEVFRTIDWNEDEVVSKGEEMILVRTEMRRELVRRIIDRVRRVDPNAPLEDRTDETL
ncbi:LPS assembly lipoprotein LptE [Biformimicrobium ophioploci]|uniref:LPS-assembly lipoprotein LptE n=1 Tax=Biformimicrobium ophioploci TaxID=3036711 RepID=A0ABQ6LWN0_9GAMM|nr:LPS assembly lipoprotein LptE [Microbulbifer sp. NKW57]GMG86490.1 hypothetical protein MNKW57_08110 [Microbulbifer sp. NKW57]